jgi:hypothetical protein
MHSQMTDFESAALEIEGDARLLLGAGMHVRDAAECISLHSLSADVGFLAQLGRLPLPPAPQQLNTRVCGALGLGQL